MSRSAVPTRDALEADATVVPAVDGAPPVRQGGEDRPRRRLDKRWGAAIVGGSGWGPGARVGGPGASEPPAAGDGPWASTEEAAEQAEWSRRDRGLRFEAGDFHGRAGGRAVGAQARARAQAYATGAVSPAAPHAGRPAAGERSCVARCSLARSLGSTAGAPPPGSRRRGGGPRAAPPLTAGRRMTDPAALPEGIVTFLFTDLEGSTRLLQAHPAAYREAVRRHHNLLRAAVEAHGGAVFETVGDAVYAAFARPTDAVKAALEGQRALRGEPWGETGELRVRMAVHLGEVERQGAHYFGAPLYRCARLLATAHGGQTVLSEAAAALVRGALPAGATLRDLGAHRLPDLREPERVAQLAHPELPAHFPPLRSLDALPNNLPRPLTSFVGREAAVAAVRERLLRPGVRLLTLTGPGGVGKTRLALRAAAEVLAAPGAFPDGAWLVYLAAVRDPALVPAAVAGALGVKEAVGRSVPEALEDFLSPKRLLLVLDNFEQVLAAGPFVARLLAAAPAAKALVTSRAVLRVAGEHDLEVLPLALPPAPAPLDPRRRPRPGPPARLSQYEAVRLFVERARAARADFAVTNETAPAVAELCHRLDGLPLALELAAARCGSCPPEALLARLGRRLPLLTGGPRDAPARQRTLRGTVAWSHDLLAPAERGLFRRLAVFAGGCTLEAAEAVCGAAGGQDGEPDVDVLEGVATLVDASLLGPAQAPPAPPAGSPAGGAGGGPRYRMLELVREYALERLEEHGETVAGRRRHAAYYAALVERGEPALRSPAAPAWLACFERELDNLRAALGWCLEAGEAGLGLRLFGKLSAHWYLRGDPEEARRWLDALLALPGAGAAPGRVRALNAGALVAVRQSDLGAVRRYAGAALATARARGDDRGAVFARVALLTAGPGETGDPDGRAAAAGRPGRGARDGRPLARGLRRRLRRLRGGPRGRGRGGGAAARGRPGRLPGHGRPLGRRRGGRRVGPGGAPPGRPRARGAGLRRGAGRPPGPRPPAGRGPLPRRRRRGRRRARRPAAGGAPPRGRGRAARRGGRPARGPARRGGRAPRRRRARTAERHRLRRARREGRRWPLDQAVEEIDEGAARPTLPGPTSGGEAGGAGAVGAPLTALERAVAALVARDFTDRRIAAELRIAEHTVATHVDHVIAKLGANSRAEVAAWAAQQGL